MALAARCPQHLGMTCRLRFCTGASCLSCICHSIKQCPCPSSARRVSPVCFVVHALWPLQLKAEQNPGPPKVWLGWAGVTYPTQAGGQGEGGACSLRGKETRRVCSHSSSLLT